MTTSAFSDAFGYAYTYKTIGNTATITSIDNSKVKDKTSLAVPSRVGAVVITQLIAPIPPAVKTLRLSYGLMVASGVSGCALTSVIFDAAVTKVIAANYQSLPVAPGCHLSIGVGLMMVAGTSLANFTGTLTIPAGSLIAPDAFKSCAFSGLYIVKGTSSIVGMFHQLPFASACTLAIGEGITAISAGAFKNCSRLVGSLIIPTTVVSIGSNAFYGCSGLTGALVLPKGLTANATFSIPEYAFYGCSGLTRLELAENITSIGPYAFYGCSGLAGELVLPKGRTANATFSIPAYAFYGCSGLTRLVLAENITSIGPYAFYGCSGLTGELVLPKGRTATSTFSIPAYAFYGCSGLTRLVLAENVTSIDKYAFAGCSGLKGDFVVPSKVWSIADGAFEGCSGLTRIVLPSGVSVIGTDAFQGCSGLNGDVMLSGAIRSIGANAFRDCSGFSSLGALEATLITHVPNGAFSGCVNLTGVLRLPKSVTSIGSNAFHGCRKLSGDLVIPSSVHTIGDGAFLGGATLGPGLVLPPSLRSIGAIAFAGCVGFSNNLAIFNNNLTIPSLVASIGLDAFKNCGFQRLRAPDTLEVSESGIWTVSTTPTGPDTIELTDSVRIPVEKYATTLTVTLQELQANPASYQNSSRSHLDIVTGAPLRPDTFKGCRFNQVTVSPAVGGVQASIGEREFVNLSSSLVANCSLLIKGGIVSIGANAFMGCANFGGILKVRNAARITIDASAVSGCNFTGISTDAAVEYVLKPNTGAPLLTFNPSTMYHVFGQAYQELGVTCQDTHTKATITPSRSPAITASTAVGSYEVEYTARNSSGETTTLTRTVHVVRQPAFTRLGADPLPRYVGDPLNDPGCTVDTKGVAMLTAVAVSGAPATDSSGKLTTAQKTTMTYTLSYTVGGVKYPTFADQRVTRVVHVVANATKSLTAMVTGHAFRIEVKFVPSVGETRVLGLMQYIRYGRLFTRIGTDDHYGTSGQWIQAPDGISTPKGSWPWGSIEGGFFVSDKLGGVTYHVAGSSHRWNMMSDTLGGFGFYERGLPFQYLARVVLSDRLLLPPYGVCFPRADEGRLFGAGWIALPLFEFENDVSDNDPLTWTFFADSENFSGPVCCYPPQFWARRIASWAALRLGEDTSLPAEYGTTDVANGLAFSGPRAGEISMGVGGEIPNMKCAFTTDDPEGSMVWKVPEIRMPAAGSAWLADASFFTERNFAQLKGQLSTGSPVTLLPKKAELTNSAEFHLGVKRVVTDGVTEIDDVLGIDARVNRDERGDAYVVSGADAGKTLGRYYVQTDTIKDTITNGTGKLVNRRVCVPTTTSGAITASEYASGSKAAAFTNTTLEQYVSARALNGIKTVTLEDGTVVRYGLVRFVEQPAIASLAADFPADFKPERLNALQKRFETLMRTNFAGQTRRSQWTNNLARVDPNMLITPVLGYVPIAVGSEPAGGGVAQPMYPATW